MNILIKVTLICGIIAFVFYGMWWFFIRIDHIDLMTIRSKSWYREVEELENYTVIVCHTRYRQQCTGVGTKRTCTSYPYQQCGPETKARQLNKWERKGDYPALPKWPEYSIGSGHYEKRIEIYTINLSDDKIIYPYNVYNENKYNSYVVKSQCEVGMNYFNFVLATGCN